MADVAHQLARQVFDRGEDSARDDITLDFGKPQFDLVKPRGIGRGVMQVELGVSLQELLEGGRFCGPKGCRQ